MVGMSQAYISETTEEVPTRQDYENEAQLTSSTTRTHIAIYTRRCRERAKYGLAITPLPPRNPRPDIATRVIDTTTLPKTKKPTEIPDGLPTKYFLKSTFNTKDIMQSPMGRTAPMIDKILSGERLFTM